MPSKLPNKNRSCLAVVAHSFNLRTQEAEHCDLFEFQDSLVYRVNSRLVMTVLQRNPVSKNKKQNKKEEEEEEEK